VGRKTRADCGAAQEGRNVILMLRGNVTPAIQEEEEGRISRRKSRSIPLGKENMMLSKRGALVGCTPED